MTTDPTPAQVLACPMERNDALAPTIGAWLIELLTTVWREQSDFSSKRPFGSSDWNGDLARALIRAGYLDGLLDADGDLDDYDQGRLDRLIAEAIAALTQHEAIDDGGREWGVRPLDGRADQWAFNEDGARGLLDNCRRFGSGGFALIRRSVGPVELVAASEPTS